MKKKKEGKKSQKNLLARVHNLARLERHPAVPLHVPHACEIGQRNTGTRTEHWCGDKPSERNERTVRALRPMRLRSSCSGSAHHVKNVATSFAIWLCVALVPATAMQPAVK
jgi:hypothetical protein